jgi:hypothetical protein
MRSGETGDQGVEITTAAGEALRAQTCSTRHTDHGAVLGVGAAKPPGVIYETCLVG